MAKLYKLVSHNDGNDEIELGEFEEETAAYIDAINTLGWSLVSEDTEEENG